LRRAIETWMRSDWFKHLIPFSLYGHLNSPFLLEGLIALSAWNSWLLLLWLLFLLEYLSICLSNFIKLSLFLLFFESKFFFNLLSFLKYALLLSPLLFPLLPHFFVLPLFLLLHLLLQHILEFPLLLCLPHSLLLVEESNC